MISIIICSTHPTTDAGLLKNIQKTIGTDYEIIHIDNSQGKYNIFEAYNLGVERAKGEYLCFMHEDILFKSDNWGPAVEMHLSQPCVGAIGVAGGCVVLDKLDWRFYGFGIVNLEQGNYTVEENPVYYISNHLEKQKIPLTQVAILDGAWIAMRKNLFQQIRFDDQTFHDFHLYDSDICMQINKMGLGVFIVFEVFIEHKSEGTYSEGYRKSLEVFAEKWKADLPFVRGMYVEPDRMKKALDKAFITFEERLHQDALIIGLRKLFNDKKKGLPVRDFTEEEIELMNKSAYRCRKYYIKHTSVPNDVVWKIILDYIKLPYAQKKWKLIKKFFWYRILRMKKKKYNFDEKKRNNDY